MTEQLTPEDHDSIDRASRALHEQGWRKEFSLNEMTSAWAQLVSKVEDGYDEQVDEYTNDLSCRDWLAAVWPMLTDRVRGHRNEELEQLDARFRRATIDDSHRLLGDFFRTDLKDGWWWKRLPAIRLGDFARTLDVDLGH